MRWHRCNDQRHRDDRSECQRRLTDGRARLDVRRLERRPRTLRLSHGAEPSDDRPHDEQGLILDGPRLIWRTTNVYARLPRTAGERVRPRRAVTVTGLSGLLLARPGRVTRLTVVLMLVLLACTRGVETPDETVSEAPPIATTTLATGEAAPVRTDRSSYVLTDAGRGPETTIIATLRAPDDRAVYIVNCNGASGVGLQRKVGDEWVPAWVIAMNACLSEPIVLPPRAEHTASIYVHENSGGVLHPRAERMIESGTYRVVWTGVLTEYDPNAEGFGPELPLEQRVSAPITIEVPPS
jgi:hypothetical protein